MRLTRQSDNIGIKAVGTLIIAVAVVLTSTKTLAPFATELAGSAYSQLNILLTDSKPTKSKPTETTRYYRLADSPGGRALVPK
jgi:hypothetical protein